MPSEEQAAEVFKTARAFFKKGDKSVNKLYVKPPDDVDTDTPAKQRRRDMVFKHQGKLQEDRRNRLGMSPSQKGDAMRDNKNTLGNCLEMSCVAVSIASERKIPSWLATTDNTADHHFCVLSDKIPTWKNIDAMGKDQISDVWIVDVWANVWAKPQDYKQKLSEHFVAWTGKGKQVAFMVGGKAPWVNADDRKTFEALQARYQLRHRRQRKQLCNTCHKENAKALAVSAGRSSIATGIAR